MTWIIVLAIMALSALFAIVLRAGLSRLHQQVRHAWSGLEALLLRRHDQLPELLERCARHLSDEPEILERLPRASAAVRQAVAHEDIPALAAAEAALRQSLARLLALAGDDPRLAADAAFSELRERLTELEASIAEHRERYNSAVNLLNVRCQAVPHRLIARASGLGQSTLLE